MAEVTAPIWDAFVQSHPEAHLLQSSAWGDLKSAFGWQAVRVIEGQTGAQILFRKLPLGLTIAYIPKGPVGVDWPALWPAVDRLCRQHNAVFLKVEPDEWEPAPDQFSSQFPGFKSGAACIQPRRTIVIDISGSPEQWLERMHQKTRYNIRLAQKKEVVVRESSDLDAFYALMRVTGGRDGFGVHADAYYRRAYRLFSPTADCAILQAEHNGRPLAALMVYRRGRRAWYLYGASSDEERNRMPTYLLQFEAMRWAAARGCVEYDLWGVPDADEETLEANFASRSDGLWGVYRFKRGFGGQLKRSTAAYERVYKPLFYKFYQFYLRRRPAEAG